MSGPPPPQGQLPPGVRPPGAYAPGASLPPGVRPPGPPPPGAVGPNGQPLMRGPGPPPPGAFPPGVRPPGVGPPPPGALPPGVRPPGVGPPPGAYPPGQGPLPPGVRPPGVAGSPPPGSFPPGALPPGVRPPGVGPPPGAYPPGQGPPPGALPPGVRPPGVVGPPPGAGGAPPGQAPPAQRPPQQQLPPQQQQAPPQQQQQQQQQVPQSIRPVAAVPSAAESKQAAAFAAAAKQREKAASEQNIRDIWSTLIDDRAAEAAASAALALRALSGDPSAAAAAAAGADSSREASIVFVGPRSSGKSTLANAFMYKDRDDVPKATTCLEYKYTRSAVKDALSENKSVTHFWELGGGRALASLLEVPLTGETLPHAMVVIVVDLARPSKVIEDLAFFIQLVRKRCEVALAAAKDKGQTNIGQQMQANARRRFGENHTDIARVDLLPVPVLICAHKQDSLKSLEPESLRILSRALRVHAHQCGASLLYTSRQAKDTLLKTYRARINAHVVGGPQRQAPAASFDHLQGNVAVTAGQDSFASIGEPSSGGAGAKTPTAAWAVSFAHTFPANDADREEDALPAGQLDDAPALDAEKSVDAALAQRSDDLRRLQRELDLRRKLNAREADGPGMLVGDAVRVR